ncbi:bifunctional DedA family/phosphatase PAP2 family protein [Marinobacter sp. M216]|uniref:Bifunctional DedA family/phosphatase PAP2 family protein n=1 Tax=Marinobacter albus TaxID=3030833 RepID=A0ABT7HHN9_9GAMM|nr:MULTISPECIES: bifunctional DedA family/phosphatase PAP2 family protein [unclassified Marinobacter]MBW7472880.1 bifunctional DedA family/phosphatase PAP2 family protein [Marinobacter sp. F4218]MDK9559432.1 bifunctional DedA family/phosphatase PAP2 family protein [Marinobacter sp. M216]
MSADWLQNLSAWLSVHPGWLAIALFSTAFVESLALAGIVVPGVAILFAFAALAGKTGMPLTETLIWAGLGAIAGDTLSFALGRKLQGRLDSVWPLSRYPKLIRKGKSFFRQHGGKSVVIGRFVGPVRPVIPLIAGALWMPWQRFLAFNIASAIGWAPVYILPGFLVGSALASEIQPPAHFYAVVGVSLAVMVVVYLVLIQFQLGLGQGSRFYSWLERRMATYDATHRFWRLYTNHRPDRGGEFPLPSLMMALGASGLLLLWGQLATNTASLEPFDQLVFAWFEQLRQPILDGPVIIATLLGDPPVLITAAILATLALVFRGYYAAAIHIVMAAALTFVLVWLLKSTLGVTRPDAVLSPPASDAFPSGHSAGITVFVTLAASFVAGETRSHNRWQSYVLLSLPLLPVALSRLYLGVHWFTDVIGGILLGMAITGAIRASYSRYDRIHLAPDVSMAVAGAVWLAFTIGYVVLAWPQAQMDFRPI